MFFVRQNKTKVPSKKVIFLHCKCHLDKIAKTIDNVHEGEHIHSLNLDLWVNDSFKWNPLESKHRWTGHVACMANIT